MTTIDAHDETVAEYPPHLDRRRTEQPPGAPINASCHTCGQTITLQLERTELVGDRVMHQCPFCRCWSMIRATDLALLLESQSVAK